MVDRMEFISHLTDCILRDALKLQVEVFQLVTSFNAWSVKVPRFEFLREPLSYLVHNVLSHSLVLQKCS